jgi:hyperosmotically inducible protein
MKIGYKILFCLSVIGFMGSGCGTAYKVVMDQRNVHTQAQDEKIEMSIRKKLADSDQVKLFDISTYCFNGNVYLVGEYDLSSQQGDAINLAKQVEGVKSVTDYFLPKKAGDLCGTTDNVELLAKVTAKLVKDDDISSTNIKVKSVQCNIVLLGLVSSKTQIDKAIAHAKSVPGVRSVKSFLKAF